MLLAQAGQLLPNALHRRRQLSQHPLGLEPQDVVAKATQHLVTPSIRSTSRFVLTTIHFDHEADVGSELVRYEASSNRNLPPESNSKPAAPDSSKKKLFGNRGIEPHCPSASSEHVGRLNETFGAGKTHGDLLVRRGPGTPNPAHDA